MRQWLLWGPLASLLIIGCGGGAEEATQEMIDHGTGKRQVETYLKLKQQIRDIQETTERSGLE